MAVTADTKFNSNNYWMGNLFAWIVFAISTYTNEVQVVYSVPSSHVEGSWISAPLLLSVNFYVAEAKHNPSISTSVLDFMIGGDFAYFL